MKKFLDSRLSVDADNGTPYPCSQRDIDRSCHSSTSRTGSFGSCTEALDDVVYFSTMDNTFRSDVFAETFRLTAALQCRWTEDGGQMPSSMCVMLE